MHIVYGDCDDGDNGNDVKSINERSLQGPFLCKMCVSVVAVVRIVDTEVDENAVFAVNAPELRCFSRF